MADRKKWVNAILYAALILALLAPRLPALGSFSTLDEPYWLSMGANFYYALGQREFQNTVYEYQPAVTTMWIVTAAMLVYFPEYRGLGQGYLEFEKGALDPFLLEYGKDPLELFYIVRAIQVLFIAFLFVILYFFLKRIIPAWAAFFAAMFASYDPYFLGQSRLLNHEAMVSLFALISALALYAYLMQGRKTAFLILSAAMAGLAQLTKSSAMALLLPIGVLFVVSIAAQEEEGIFKSIGEHAKIFAAWLLVMAGAYFIFWPGMWVAPGKMLYEVYGNAFSYAFQGARLKITEELQPSQFSLNSGVSGILYFIKIFLWRTTPLTWMGIALGFIFPARAPQRANKILSALLVSAAAAFILLFGIAQGRNSPHYILTSYLALNLFAGLGWFYALQHIAEKYRIAALILVFGLQAYSGLAHYPYYYTYGNPILKTAGWYAEFPQMPYGEGLELAARELASLPNAENSSALVYYARGCFSFFYPGETLRFKPYYVDEGYEENLAAAIRASDYLVVYYATQGQMPRYNRFLRALQPAQPLREIWMDGYKYIVIYEASSLPSSVLEALSP